jgi:hypothetical protein
MPRYKRMLSVALALGVVGGLVTAGAAYATLPNNTPVTAALASGTDMTFIGSINGVSIDVSCTSFSGSGTTPSSPSDTVTLANPPVISGCTDSLEGNDTITTNQKNGNWVLTGKGKKAPYKLTLTIPKAGATFSSSVLSSCVVTAAPKKAVKVTGKYDGVNTDTVSNAKIATAGTGCSSTTADTSATVVLSPSPGKLPF